MSNRLAPTLVFLVATATATAVLAGPPPRPRGDQTAVSQVAAGDQTDASIVMLQNGNFYVSWQSQAPPGLAGEPLPVIATRAFLGNGDSGHADQPAGMGQHATIGVDDQGNTLVVWEAQTANGRDILGARCGPDQCDDAFLINQVVAGDQTDPAVAVRRDGVALVVWQGPDASGTGIFGRLLDFGMTLTGVVGDELQLNTITNGIQGEPRAAASGFDNGFGVVWEGPRESGLPAVFLRRVDPSGDPLGAEIDVTVAAAPASSPDLAIEAGAVKLAGAFGDLVVTWEAPDSDGNGIWARRFNPALEPVTGEFQVNQVETGDQRSPAVAVDDVGQAVYVWTSQEQALGSTEVLGSPIFIKGIKGTGGLFQEPQAKAILTEEFRVDTTGTELANPRVAAEPRGNFAVVWEGFGVDTPDSFGVFFQRFGDVLFYDGFETGNTSNWSSAVP